MTEDELQRLNPLRALYSVVERPHALQVSIGRWSDEAVIVILLWLDFLVGGRGRGRINAGEWLCRKGSGGEKWHGRKEQRAAEFFRRVACLISMAEYIKM